MGLLFSRALAQKQHKNEQSYESSYKRLGPASAFSVARYQRLDEEQLLDRVAELFEQENVVGWFQGRLEFGPRALGGRSIIGDPRSETMQSVMN